MFQIPTVLNRKIGSSSSSSSSSSSRALFRVDFGGELVRVERDIVDVMPGGRAALVQHGRRERLVIGVVVVVQARVRVRVIAALFPLQLLVLQHQVEEFVLVADHTAGLFASSARALVEAASRLHVGVLYALYLDVLGVHEHARRRPLPPEQLARLGDVDAGVARRQRPAEQVKHVRAAAVREEVGALVLARDVLVGGAALAYEDDVKGEEAADGKDEQAVQREQTDGRDRARLEEVRRGEHDQEAGGEHAAHVHDQE
jgi:hypothetical protein